MEKHVVSAADYYKLERGAEITAGLDGYIGHLPERELKRRIDKYCKIISQYEPTENGGH